jgi:hypothetical protein
MSVGLGIGLTLLLGAASFDRAVHVRDARETTRLGPSYEAVESGPSAGKTRMWFVSTFLGSQRLDVVVVKGVGRAPVPPGIPRLPAPGEAFVSPALARALDGPGEAVARRRVPGRIAGVIGPSGLRNPRELYAYVSAAAIPGRLLGRPQSIVTAFAPDEFPSGPPDLGTVAFVALLVIAVLVPVAVFIVTVTRISSTTREGRLAAVRLAGGTQSQVRWLASAEVGLAAVLGCLISAALFFPLRSWVSGLSLPVLDGGWFPGDMTPTAPDAVALFIGVPLFAVVIAEAALRGVVISPLGVVRRARARTRGWRWLAILIGGVVILTFCAGHRNWLMRQQSPGPGIAIGVALLLVLVGVAGATPWIARSLGRAIASSRPAPAFLLAGRRLETDVASVGRASSSIAVVMGIFVVLQSIFLTSDVGSVPPGIAALAPTDVVVRLFERPGLLPGLRHVPGVLGEAISSEDPSGGTTGRPSNAVIHTDGNPATVERIRDALPWVYGGDVTTAVQERTAWEGHSGGVATGLEILLVVLLFVTGASFLVSTIDGLMERRRPLAALSAIGVPSGILRRSTLVHVSVPLAVALVVGLWAGVVTSKLVFDIADQALVLPDAQIVATASAVGGVALLVTAVCLPWLRIARRPELLRND